MSTEFETGMQRHARQARIAFELVLEQAVQGGQHGVLVTKHTDFKAMRYHETYQVSPDVPYGMIHEVEV